MWRFIARDSGWAAGGCGGGGVACALVFNYEREGPTQQSLRSLILPPPLPLCGTLDTLLHRVLCTNDVVKASAEPDISFPVLRMFLLCFSRSVVPLVVA